MKPKTQRIEFQFKPKGSSKSFPVQIPANIVSVFQNPDEDEDREIVRSVVILLDGLFKKHQAAKDQPINDVVEAKQKFTPASSIIDQYEDIFSVVPKAREYRNDRRVKDEVLRSIKHFPTLNLPEIQPLITRAVLLAIEDNDHKFFCRFGRLLENPSSLPYTPPKSWTPLQRLVADHWVTSDDNELPFCYFSDQALADFLHLVAPKSNPTFDSVRKTRQRFKLRQGKKRLIKTALLQSGSIVLG